MNKFLRQLSLLALLFCWPLMSQAARTFTDQLGRQVMRRAINAAHPRDK
ncbi:hypothetical protein HXP91_002864 [Salmonella enterica]|nr:hypothetical protein [Salmonella enterica]EKG1877818.1 hypothetical protein [Salmonella enterica]EKR4488484.1 hypothetical protein [Salmonella enterica]EKS9660286.1 hypothetical protein [Salmonella enterica]EMB4266897.1 hypothetical protein [Salmonella enterica]